MNHNESKTNGGESEQESTEQKKRLIPDGGLEAVVNRFDADDDLRVSVTIGEDQYLVDGTMSIDSLGDPDALDARRTVGFAADRLRDADTLTAPISWQSEIVESLSVEEIVGALLAADAELDQLDEENADLRERVRELRADLREAAE